MVEHWWIPLAALVVVTLLMWPWFPLWFRRRKNRFSQARRDFHRHREWLEAKFLQLGMASTKVDAPRWTDCEFDDDVTYVRNRTTGELSAFVAVTVEIEDPDGRSPGLAESIGNLRAATAVFRFNHGRWETDGRALFNLSPAEAIRFYHRELEMLGQEVVTPRFL